MIGSEEKKVDILLEALKERYESVRVIRQRVQNTCIWSLGVMAAIGGWLVQGDISLSNSDKALYLVGVIAAFSVLRFVYLADLERGLRKQLQVAAAIEEKLELFSPNVYGKSSVYPSDWKDAGGENGGGNFTKSVHSLLYIGVIILLCAVFFTG